MKKATIIILMFNDAESTINLVKSIEHYSCLDSIIIVDNCSTNDSWGRVQFLKNEHIHIIRTIANEGIAKGNNFGAEYAKKINPDISYYLFSNPDVIVNSESIVAMIDFLDSYEEAGAVCPMELTKEGELAIDFAWRFSSYWQRIKSVMPISLRIEMKKKPYLWFYNPQDVIEKDVFWADVIISCFIMIRRSYFELVNGFCEDTFLYHEEDILAYKFKQNGIKLAVLPKYRITHLGCSSMDTAYKDWERKSDILFDSSVVYLKKCLNISNIGLLFYKLMYKVGVFERKVYRKITRKDRGNQL